MDYTHSYLIYTLIFLAFWGVLFLLRADLRRRMLLFSLCALPLGPLSEIWFLRDYWQRPTLTGMGIGVEDGVFAFALGGISFAIYKVASGKRVVSSEYPTRHGLLGVFAALVLVPLIIGTSAGLNSVVVTTLSFVGFAALLWWLRPDLILASLVSGLLTLLTFILVYQLLEALFPGVVLAWCKSCNPSGVRVLGVNIEELAWDFSWGLVGGALYEAVRGKRLAPLREHRVNP